MTISAPIKAAINNNPSVSKGRINSRIRNGPMCDDPFYQCHRHAPLQYPHQPRESPHRQSRMTLPHTAQLDQRRHPDQWTSSIAVQSVLYVTKMTDASNSNAAIADTNRFCDSVPAFARSPMNITAKRDQDRDRTNVNENLHNSDEFGVQDEVDRGHADK